MPTTQDERDRRKAARRGCDGLFGLRAAEREVVYRQGFLDGWRAGCAAAFNDDEIVDEGDYGAN